MTSQQWFQVADVCLLFVGSCAAVLVMIFTGALVLDLIDKIRSRWSAAGAQDAITYRNETRPRVWPRTTARPLGSIRPRRRATGEHEHHNAGQPQSTNR